MWVLKTKLESSVKEGLLTTEPPLQPREEAF